MEWRERSRSRLPMDWRTDSRSRSRPSASFPPNPWEMGPDPLTYDFDSKPQPLQAIPIPIPQRGHEVLEHDFGGGYHPIPMPPPYHPSASMPAEVMNGGYPMLKMPERHVFPKHVRKTSFDHTVSRSGIMSDVGGRHQVNGRPMGPDSNSSSLVGFNPPFVICDH